MTNRFVANRTILTIGLLVLMSSCSNVSSEKSKSVTEVKTLEDLASGESVGGDNICSGSFPALLQTDRIDVDKSGPSFQGASAATTEATLRAAVNEYLTAIPEPMQRAFIKLGGRILITDKASSLCSSGFADSASLHYVSPKRRAIESCYLYLNDTDATPAGATGTKGSRAVFTIVHQPNVAAIRHGGVRIFGFLYAQFYARLYSAGQTSVAFKLQGKESAQFYTHKKALAEAFLRDIVRSTSFDLIQLESLLGEGSAQIVKKNVLDGTSKDPLAGVAFHYADDAAAVARTEQSSLRASRFYDFVFAEAFDSFYCNADSLALMRRDFALSFGAFSPLNSLTLQVSKRLTGSGTASLIETNMGDENIYDRQLIELFPRDIDDGREIDYMSQISPSRQEELPHSEAVSGIFDKVDQPETYDPLQGPTMIGGGMGYDPSQADPQLAFATPAAGTGAVFMEASSSPEAQALR